MNSQTSAKQGNQNAKKSSQSPKAKGGNGYTGPNPAATQAVQKKSADYPTTPPASANAPVNNQNAPVSQSPATHQKDTVAREAQFHLDAPSAREVLLAGEFTGWNESPLKLIKGGGGVWHIKVPLPPGRHLYRFVVDGEWRDDPNCQGHVPNPFGTVNSVVEIH